MGKVSTWDRELHIVSCGNRYIFISYIKCTTRRVFFQIGQPKKTHRLCVFWPRYRQGHALYHTVVCVCRGPKIRQGVFLSNPMDISRGSDPCQAFFLCAPFCVYERATGMSGGMMEAGDKLDPPSLRLIPLNKSPTNTCTLTSSVCSCLLLLFLLLRSYL